ADMRAETELGPNGDEDKSACTKKCLKEYKSHAWNDFIEKQLGGFGKLPIYLGIGNHEISRYTIANEPSESFANLTRDDCARKDDLSIFTPWLDTSTLRKYRCTNSTADCPPKTYYHWVLHNVDFIELDNGGDDGFSSEQMPWFKELLQHDEAEPAIRTVVVG